MENFSTKTPVNMAPSGIATFAKTDLCTDLHHIDADIAILGAPFDIGIQGKTGTRLGPRGIRIASTRFRYKSGGSYDPERDTVFLDTDRWKIVDCGDVDYVPGDLDTSLDNLTAAIEVIRSQGVMPVVLGGDHSITYPILRGFEDCGGVYIIHFDAHLDWTKEIGGQTLSNGSPMRNCAALEHVESILTLGVRGIGSSGPQDFADAKAQGTKFYSPKEIRRIGIEQILTALPQGAQVYITIDIDAMDATMVPGTGSPMFGGFDYDEMVEMFEAIAKRHPVIGIDLAEVSPPYDVPGDTTCYLAARLISDLLGFVTKERE
jgi:agmatinase